MKNYKTNLLFGSFKRELGFSEYTLNRIIIEVLDLTPTEELRNVVLETDLKYNGIIIGTEQLKLDPIYSIDIVKCIQSSEKYKLAIEELKRQMINTLYNKDNMLDIVLFGINYINI